MDTNQNDNCWRGTPFEEIYRGLSEWELSHLPPIMNRRNHTVLFELPIDVNSTIPPKPHGGQMKWDSLHVRMPCSPQNEYIVTDEVRTFSISLYGTENIFQFVLLSFRMTKIWQWRSNDGKLYRMHYCNRFWRVVIWKRRFCPTIPNMPSIGNSTLYMNYSKR